MPYFHQQDANLYYHVEGIGEPIIFISGLNCDLRIWNKTAEELKKNYQAITMDNRGVGESDAIKGVITIEMLAQDVIALMHHLNIGKATLVGHSMGGTVVQTIAYLKPEMVQKLVICNSLIKVGRLNRFLGALLQVLRVCGVAPQPILKRAFPFLFAKKFRKDKTRLKEVANKFIVQPNCPEKLFTHQKQLQALLQFDSRPWLSQLSVPTLVIAGAQDRLCPHDSKMIAALIPQAKFISLPEVGHVPMIETPDHFISILKEFIN